VLLVAVIAALLSADQNLLAPNVRHGQHATYSAQAHLQCPGHAKVFCCY
jgi:hypothetical protein